MKKITALLLSVLLAVACSVPASAKAAFEKKVTFSFGMVSGKAGDIVYVDFSLLDDDTFITDFAVKFAYDGQKVEWVKNPANGKMFTPGTVLTMEHSPDDDPVSYVFFDDTMELHVAEPTSLCDAGVVGTFAFRLLTDIPDEESVMGYYFRSWPLYYGDNLDLIAVEWIDVKNALDYNLICPDGMENNQLHFSLNENSGKEYVSLRLTLQESYSYLESVEITFVYDTTRLELYSFSCPGVNRTDDPNAFLMNNAGGIVFNGYVGNVVFRVLDVTPTDVPIPVTAEFSNGVHATDKDFVYDISCTQGTVYLEYTQWTFEVREEGAVLVGYRGNEPVVTIPSTYEGVLVTAIGEKVFQNATHLQRVFIPAGVTDIARNAFEGCNLSLIIRCPKNSAADEMADENGFSVSHYVPAEVVIANDVLPLGDLCTDGVIDAKDALYVLQLAVCKHPLEAWEVQVSDVNKDTYVNAKDALEILKKTVGKPACF